MVCNLIKLEHIFIKSKLLAIIFFIIPCVSFAQCIDTLNLGNDTILCTGDSVILDAGPGYLDYLWSNGDTTQTIKVGSTNTYWCIVHIQDTTNVVFNGDFSFGNIGFTSNYTLGTGGPWGLLSYEGTYAITTNAQLTHNNFASCSDHTTGTGNMMVVNGTGIANQHVWSQIIVVIPNRDYRFSAWFTSVVSSSPAMLNFTINSQAIGSVVTISPTTCNWQNFFQTWNSGTSTTATISITNQNTAMSGNDFAIDDIYFSQVCMFTDSINVTVNQYPVVDIGNDTTLCQNDSIILDATTSDASYIWQDNSTDSVLTASLPGTYWVDVTVNGCITRDSIEITYNPLPTVYLGEDTTLCQGEILLLDVTAPNATYLWQDNSTNPTYNVSITGIFHVDVTISECTNSDTIIIDYTPLPVVNLGYDSTICEGDTLLLDVTTPNASYLWNNNSVNPTLLLTSMGTYWVEVDISGCKSADTIEIASNPKPFINLGNDIVLCDRQSFNLYVSFPGANYLWHNGSTNSSYHVNSKGVYWVEVYNDCGTVTDSINVEYIICDCSVYVPNTFTPDNNGINDIFIPKSNCTFLFCNFMIFNRWGTEVFKSNNIDNGWDGVFKGTNSQSGVYVWLIQYQSKENGIKESKTGKVMLIR